MAKSEARTLRVGDVLDGKYRIGQTLGQGGMGAVFDAVELASGARVAIKVLHPSLAGETRAVRLEREALALASIESTHVARVLDTGNVAPTQPYVVMQRLVGRDLAARLREEGPLSMMDVADIAVQVCDALAYAHGAGIVHRDIKPTNLFEHEEARGRVLKVLDFGISKRAVRGPSERTLTSTRDGMLGSPHYMSPEQVRSPRDVDHRADIWSLGVVMYRLLSGHVPFDGDAIAAISRAIVAGDLVTLAERGVCVPHEFEAIVMRCLAGDREERFADVAELATALEPWVSPRARSLVERVRERVRAVPTPMCFARAPRDGDEPCTSTVHQAHRARSASWPERLTRVSILDRHGVTIGAVGALLAFALAFALGSTRTTPERRLAAQAAPAYVAPAQTAMPTAIVAQPAPPPPAPLAATKPIATAKTAPRVAPTTPQQPPARVTAPPRASAELKPSPYASP